MEAVQTQVIADEQKAFVVEVRSSKHHERERVDDDLVQWSIFNTVMSVISLFVCLTSILVSIIAFMLKMTLGIDKATIYAHMYFNCLYTACILLLLVQLVSGVWSRMKHGPSKDPSMSIPEVAAYRIPIFVTSLVANIKLGMLFVVSIKLRAKGRQDPSIQCEESSRGYLGGVVVRLLFNIGIILIIFFHSKALTNGAIRKFQVFGLLIILAVTGAAWSDLALVFANVMIRYQEAHRHNLTANKIDKSDGPVNCFEYFSGSSSAQKLVPSLTIIVVAFYLKCAYAFLLAIARYMNYGPHLGLISNEPILGNADEVTSKPKPGAKSKLRACGKCCSQPVVIIAVASGVVALLSTTVVSSLFGKWISKRALMKAWLVMETYSLCANVIGTILVIILFYYIVLSFNKALIRAENNSKHKLQHQEFQLADDYRDDIIGHKLNPADSVALFISMAAGIAYFLLFQVSVFMSNTAYFGLGIATALIELAQMMIQTICVILMKKGLLCPEPSDSEPTVKLIDGKNIQISTGEIEFVDRSATSINLKKTTNSWSPILTLVIALLGFYNLVLFTVALLRQEQSLYGEIFRTAYGPGTAVFLRAFVYGVYAFYRTHCVAVFIPRFIAIVKP